MSECRVVVDPFVEKTNERRLSFHSLEEVLCFIGYIYENEFIKALKLNEDGLTIEVGKR